MDVKEYLSTQQLIPMDLYDWDKWTAAFVYSKLVDYLKDAPRQDGGVFVMPSSRKMSKIIGVNFKTYLAGLKQLNELGYIRILNEGKPENIRIQMKHTIAVEKYTELCETEKKLYIINKEGKKTRLSRATIAQVERMGATPQDIEIAISACEQYEGKIINMHKFFPSLFNPTNGRCIALDKKQYKAESKKQEKPIHVENPDELPAYVTVSELHTFKQLSITMQQLANGETILRDDLPYLGKYEECFIVEDNTLTLKPQRVVVHLGDMVPERKGQWIFPYNQENDKVDFWNRLTVPGERKRKTPQERIIGFKQGHEVKSTPGVRTSKEIFSAFTCHEVPA